MPIKYLLIAAHILLTVIQNSLLKLVIFFQIANQIMISSNQIQIKPRAFKSNLLVVKPNHHNDSVMILIE